MVMSKGYYSGPQGSFQPARTYDLLPENKLDMSTAPVGRALLSPSHGLIVIVQGPSGYTGPFDNKLWLVIRPEEVFLKAPFQGTTFPLWGEPSLLLQIDGLGSSSLYNGSLYSNPLSSAEVGLVVSSNKDASDLWLVARLQGSILQNKNIAHQNEKVWVRVRPTHPYSQVPEFLPEVIPPSGPLSHVYGYASDISLLRLKVI